MSEIIDSNYETVSAKCAHCGALCIFSRVDDLGSVGPVSGERVLCSACGRDFWITGDTIDTAYQFLINDAKEHFHLKRYMPAIASLAQAWEVFFAEFTWGRYVYAPFFAGDIYSQDADELNSLSRQLASVTRTYTFASMRNVLIHTVARNIQPTSVGEANVTIPRIEAEKLGERSAAVAVFSGAGARSS